MLKMLSTKLIVLICVFLSDSQYISEAKCEPGKWGKNCEHSCGYCKDTTPCDSVDGACASTGCLPGYKASSQCLSKCQNGTYGEFCLLHCSKNCLLGICNNVDGTCTNCISGWKGSFCEKECSEGEWGPDCSKTCGKCSDVQTCDRMSGKCSKGCLPGYKKTELCDQECENGKFGKDCENTCNQNCTDVCNKIKGDCDLCTTGRTGSTCNSGIDVEQVDDTPVPTPAVTPIPTEPEQKTEKSTELLVPEQTTRLPDNSAKVSGVTNNLPSGLVLLLASSMITIVSAL